MSCGPDRQKNEPNILVEDPPPPPPRSNHEEKKKEAASRGPVSNNEA